jgi:hypothetical protein
MREVLRVREMQSRNISSIQTLFQSRLMTLEHLLKSAQTHFSSESFLQQRIAADMLPFGTQIAFTCNQPHNFSLWCDGKPLNNLDPEVVSLAQAYTHIEDTKELLSGISAKDEKLDEIGRIDLGQGFYVELSGIDLGQGFYVELSGIAYVNDFLIPNFYFHMVTAYDILRMAGVPIGKRDYMIHLVPFVKQA